MLNRFYNGGMIFSTVVLLFIALISLYSFVLLVRTRLVVHGSFGGELIHYCVTASITDPNFNRHWWNLIRKIYEMDDFILHRSFSSEFLDYSLGQ